MAADERRPLSALVVALETLVGWALLGIFCWWLGLWREIAAGSASGTTGALFGILCSLQFRQRHRLDGVSFWVLMAMCATLGFLCGVGEDSVWAMFADRRGLTLVTMTSFICGIPMAVFVGIAEKRLSRYAR